MRVPGAGDLLGQIFVRISASTKGLTGGLAAAEHMSRKTGRKVSQSLSTIEHSMGNISTASTKMGKDISSGFAAGGAAADKLSKKLGAIGGFLANPWVIGAIAVGGFTLALKSSMQAFSQYEKALANVTTLFDTAVYSVGDMSDSLLRLDATLGSVIGLTHAAYQAISSGVEPIKAIDAIAQAALFAKAALVDQFTAIDVGTTVVNAYGMEIEELDRVYAVLFKTIEQGKTVGPELSQHLGMVIPFAATLGVRITELNAALAAMTKGGVATSRATTSLRQVFATFLAPAKEAKDLAAELGVELDSNVIATKGMIGALDQLAKASLGNSEAIATFFGNIRALTAVLQLTGNLSGEYARILGILETAYEDANAHQVAFEKQLDTISGQWERLTAILERYQISLGTGPGELYKNLLKSTTDVLQEMYLAMLDLNDRGWPMFLAWLKAAVDELGGVSYEGSRAEKTFRLLYEAIITSTGRTIEFTVGQKRASKALRGQERSLAGVRGKLLKYVSAANLATMSTVEIIAALHAFQKEVKETAEEFERLAFVPSEEHLTMMKKLFEETEELQIKLITPEGIERDLALQNLEYNRLLAASMKFEADQLKIAENFDLKKAIAIAKNARKTKRMLDELQIDIVKSRDGDLAGEIAKLQAQANEKLQIAGTNAEAKLKVEEWFMSELDRLHKEAAEEEIKEQEKLKKAITRSGLDNIGQAEARYQVHLEKLQAYLDTNIEFQKEFNERVTQLDKDLAEKKKEIREQEHQDLLDSYQQQIDDIIDQNTKKTELDVLYQVANYEAYVAALDQQTAATIAYYENVQTVMDIYTEAMITSQRGVWVTFAEVGQAAVDQISSGLAQLVVQGGNIGEVFKQIGKSLIQMFVELMIKQALSWALANILAAAHLKASIVMAVAVAAAWAPAAALVSAATFGASAVAGAAALLMIAGVAAGIAASAVAVAGGAGGADPGVLQGTGQPQLQFMAEGGYVDRPTLAVIGEEGPEFVIPEDKMANAGLSGYGSITIGEVVIENYGDLVSPVDLEMLAETAAEEIANRIQARMKGRG